MYHTNMMVVRLLMSLKEWGLIDFSSVRIRYLGKIQTNKVSIKVMFTSMIPAFASMVVTLRRPKTFFSERLLLKTGPKEATYIIRFSGTQEKACIPIVFKRLSERRLKKNTYILLEGLGCSI